MKATSRFPTPAPDDGVPFTETLLKSGHDFASCSCCPWSDHSHKSKIYTGFELLSKVTNLGLGHEQHGLQVIFVGYGTVFVESITWRSLRLVCLDFQSTKLRDASSQVMHSFYGLWPQSIVACYLMIATGPRTYEVGIREKFVNARWTSYFRAPFWLRRHAAHPLLI